MNRLAETHLDPRAQRDAGRADRRRERIDAENLLRNHLQARLAPRDHHVAIDPRQREAVVGEISPADHVGRGRIADIDQLQQALRKDAVLFQNLRRQQRQAAVDVDRQASAAAVILARRREIQPPDQQRQRRLCDIDDGQRGVRRGKRLDRLAGDVERVALQGEVHRDAKSVHPADDRLGRTRDIDDFNAFDAGRDVGVRAAQDHIERRPARQHILKTQRIQRIRDVHDQQSGRAIRNDRQAVPHDDRAGLGHGKRRVADQFGIEGIRQIEDGKITLRAHPPGDVAVTAGHRERGRRPTREVLQTDYGVRIVFGRQIRAQPRRIRRRGHRIQHVELPTEFERRQHVEQPALRLRIHRAQRSSVILPRDFARDRSAGQHSDLDVHRFRKRDVARRVHRLRREPQLIPCPADRHLVNGLVRLQRLAGRIDAIGENLHAVDVERHLRDPAEILRVRRDDQHLPLGHHVARHGIDDRDRRRGRVAKLADRHAG